jgi:hypothetical protein
LAPVSDVHLVPVVMPACWANRSNRKVLRKGGCIAPTTGDGRPWNE